MPWRVPIWFERELETLQVLSKIPDANTPRLLAYGDSVSDEDSEHPYLIMERLDGETFYKLRQQLTIEEQCEIVMQLAKRVRAMHEAPITGLKSFRKEPSDWVQLIRARSELWAADRTDQVPFLQRLPEHLKAQALEFLTENLPLVTEDFHPCLLSGDINAWNILIAKQDDKWEVTGHIDFGFAEIGPIEYEWVSICQTAFAGDETLMRAFFTAYGWPLPMSHDVRQRLKLYTLLHRFVWHPALFEETSEGPSLEVILDGMWPI